MKPKAFGAFFDFLSLEGICGVAGHLDLPSWNRFNDRINYSEQ